MREIKFRGFCKLDNVMVYKINSLRLVNGELERDDYELMQYTGLKDKNGKEIYEGDIVIDEWGDDKMIHSVKFDLENAQFLFYSINTSPVEINLFSDLLDVRIIGNIYENPELLETIEK